MVDVRERFMEKATRERHTILTLKVVLGSEVPSP
jgi:hypothetical protein